MGGGGVQRWLKTTKYIRTFNWEPVIFTTSNGEISVEDREIQKEIPEGVEVIRTSIWEPFDIYKKLIGKKKNEKIAAGMATSTKGKSIMQKLSVWVRGNLFIPDARKFWIKPASKYLINYLKENKVDAIISTGPPHTTHMIALRINQYFKKHPEFNSIPWLADFRDPWTNIDFYHKLMLTNWADKKHKKFERLVLDSANQIVTVTWSWAEDFYKISGRLPIVITNGYDPEDFLDAGKLKLDNKFTITHTGSLNDDRNPALLWEVLGKLIQDNADIKNDLEIKFIGQVDDTVFGSISENGLKNNLIKLGNINHSEVIKYQIKSQILLLPLNDTPNINGIVPGKLYEYLGAQRPILCIGKIDGDAAKIISDTNAGKVIGFKDATKMGKIILQFYHLYKAKKLYVKSKNYQKYSRKILAGQIAEELNKMV